MKKVLLTTTALVMTAGVAAAEVSFSGTAQVSMAAEAGADMTLRTHIDVNAAVSGSTDNGMTMSTSFGYDAGEQVDYNDDFEIDAVEGGTPNNNNWSGGAPEVAIGYNGWTITAQAGGVENKYDGDVENHDLSIDGSIGGVTVGFGTTSGAGGASSYSVGYTAGDISASMASTSDDGAGASAMSFSLSYTMGDATITASSDNEGAAETTNSVGVSYAMGDLTVGYTMAGDNGANMGDDYDLSVGYSAGPLSASFATNETSRTRVVAEYDLGGATAFFSSQQGGGSVQLSAMGINFAF
jgi:outer membrane protein OmpU